MKSLRMRDNKKGTISADSTPLGSPLRILLIVSALSEMHFIWYLMTWMDCCKLTSLVEGKDFLI